MEYYSSHAIEKFGRRIFKANQAQHHERAIAVIDDGQWRTAGDDVKQLFDTFAVSPLIISFALYAVPASKLHLCAECGGENSRYKVFARKAAFQAA